MNETRHTYDEKLGRILQTAAAIFADKGYHDTSIRDISKATGVSLSGLYYYFRSKEELLFLVMDHCFGTVLQNAQDVLAGETDPHRRLRRFVENHLRYFVSNMKEMKVLSHEARSLTGDYRRLVNAKKREYTDICIGILRDLAGSDALDPRIGAYALFGMMNWIYNWYRPEHDVPVAELAENMSQLFLHGYLSGATQPSAASRVERSPSIWRPL
jgi:TetR/AcrR family transcriptional regulator, cholesterol catabolism regulator